MSDVQSQPVKHPAKFSDTILQHIGDLIDANQIEGLALDPFAGVGRVHELRGEMLTTVGVELEREWAEQDPRTIHGSVLGLRALGFDPESVDAIITSPCYGNRMADKHDARDGSRRFSYKHVLGRTLSADSAAGMQWGREYRAFHAAAWAVVLEVLRPGGWFVLNVSDHIRGKEVQPVVDWHKAVLQVQGVDWLRDDVVGTPRLRVGQNSDARVDGERVLLGRKR